MASRNLRLVCVKAAALHAAIWNVIVIHSMTSCIYLTHSPFQGTESVYVSLLKQYSGCIPSNETATEFVMQCFDMKDLGLLVRNEKSVHIHDHLNVYIESNFVFV